MYKLILFTHDDLDGAGCRIIMEVALTKGYLVKDKDYIILNCTNGGLDSDVIGMINSGDIGPDTYVIFADICASREVLRRLEDEVQCHIGVYDHHRTNFFAEHEIHAPNVVKIIPENKLRKLQSGTSILYQELCKEAYSNSKMFMGINDDTVNHSLSEFVDTVRSYDTWEWATTKNIEARRLQVLFQLLGMDRFCQFYVDRYTEGTGDTKELIPGMADIFVSARMENEQKIIDSLTPNDPGLVICSVRGKVCALLMRSTGANFSELGNQFCSKYPDVDFIASLSLADSGVLSFRTVKDNLDLGADIAKPIGGGGHPAAAGASLDEETKALLAGIIIHYMNGEKVKSIEFEGTEYE